MANLTDPIALLARRYLDSLLLPDRSQALETISQGLANGVPITNLYFDVIAQAQHRIGELWEQNIVSVSQEHVATAISQLAISQMYSVLPRKEPLGRTALVACVEGELHDLGARMVADVLEVEGFDVVLLGANTPTESLVDMARALSPQVVALSVSMAPALHAAREVVGQILEVFDGKIEVVVGGHAAEELEAIEGLTIVRDIDNVSDVISRLRGSIDDVNRTP